MSWDWMRSSGERIRIEVRGSPGKGDKPINEPEEGGRERENKDNMSAKPGEDSI